MIKSYKILTVTHHQTTLGKIGNFVIKESEGDALKQKLETLKAQFDLEELMYLATCNRVTYFFFSEQNVDLDFQTSFFQAIRPELTTAQIKTSIIAYEGLAALEHLFKVAASIDSLVVGEREILRQLREASDRCEQWKLTGNNIRLAMNLAVVAAKEVYAKTRIGEKPISVVSLAIGQLLKCQLPKTARILMIGAGQTNTLVTKFLVKHQFTDVTIFNRSLEKAEVLAKQIQGDAFTLSELRAYQKGFDCLIICTGATQAIVDTSLYQTLLNGEKGKKVVIDLSVPRNISSEVVAQFDINYIEIEGLRALAQSNLAFRQQEVVKADEFLVEHLEQFQITYRQRQITRAMNCIPKEIKAVKERAMTQVFKKELDALDAETQLLFEKMMTYMEKKCIGIPMRVAKEVVV